MSTIFYTHRLRFAHWVSRWLLYPVLYYLIRYRKKVVRENLLIAFPEHSDKQRRQWERAFYLAFTDMIVEIIVGRHFNEEVMLNLLHFDHKPEVAQCCKQHGGGFFMLGHFLNWEWAIDYANQFAQYDLQCASIYKKLTNRFFNNLMLNIRKQRGGLLIEMDQLLRTMITNKKNHTTIAYAMLADQRPRKQSTKIPMVLLGQDVDMLFGTEQLARRFAYPVYYVSVLSSQRGHYQFDFHLIYDPDTEADTGQGVVTQRFTQHLEQNILQEPSRWLWTHRRFLNTHPHTPTVDS